MDRRSRTAFGLLIAAQAAHSIEEYVFRLFDVFAPARVVGALVSSDTARGFALVNAGLVVFGLWCYLARVRPARSSARAYAWFWTCLEFANGVGHVMLAAVQGGYVPGVGTAPALVALSSYLGAGLTRRGRQRDRSG